MEEEEDVTYNSEEGDETITLSEIVAGREVTVREEELWALCRECCLTLEFVHSTQELFQSLIITPETVAFDREGNVCFLDLDADPEPLYIPPEYVEAGCSYKSHLYSLGMTLLFAVEYLCTPEDEHSKPDLTSDLTGLLTHLTQDDPDNRPDLELVLEYCDRALQHTSSQDVCQRFACAPPETEAPSRGSENESSLQLVTDELAAYLQKQTGLVVPSQRASNSNSDCDSGRHPSSARHQAWTSENHTPSGEAVEEVNGVSDAKQQSDSTTSAAKSPTMEPGHGSQGDDSCTTTPRRGKRRQGLLLADVLSTLDRSLLEAELWALCRECIISLQRKKKHLPAYISPDTVMIREVGNVSFKAIPEDKPLEVIYMAPELQQKGILNEKTCLFGLGVTLRSAAGEKHGSAELDAAIGPAFKELIDTLLQLNPDFRPSLELALMACDEYEKQSSVSSRSLCQEIFMDANVLTSSREPKRSELLSLEQENVAMATEMQASWTGAGDMEKEGVFLDDGLDDEGVEPPPPETKASAFQSVTAQQPTTGPLTGSAFKPVPVKPKPVKQDPTGSEPRLPSAFSSPATHFKPIILQTSATDLPASNGDAGDLQVEEKEKNVVRKLKEIKKNLLKHRPPGNLSKDVELDDSKPPAGEKSKTPRTASSNRSSRKSSSAGESAGALENFLQQLQSSGQMPDTNNLALAIAQHLQAQLGTGGTGDGVVNEGVKPLLLDTPSKTSKRTSEISANGSDDDTKPLADSSLVEDSQTLQQSHPVNTDIRLPVTTTAGESLAQDSFHPLQSQQVASSLSLPPFAGPLPALSMASVVQTGGYVGQNMPVPVMSFPGGVLPGPMQYQLQQDPRTGFMQLVPVPVLPFGSQPVPSHSPHTSGADLAYNSWQQPIAVSPSVGLGQDFSAESEDYGYRNAGRPSGSSRNARGLIQKTAAQRAKNTASASNSPTGYLSDHGASYSKISSYLEDDSFQDSSSVQQKDGFKRHRRSNSSGANIPLDHRVLSVHEKSGLVTEGQTGNVDYSEDRGKQRTRGIHSQNTTQGHRSVSQSSSPSPSKDSGICVTHNAAASQVSSASLMERLLSSESLRHQQTVTQVLLILNQGFGEHGPDTFQREELLAEYIVSLAHLKWETFMRAVTEKYSDLFWSHTLLVNLYHAVNSAPSSTSAKSPPTAQSKPFHYGEKDASGHQFHEAQAAARSRQRSEPSYAEEQAGKEGMEPSGKFSGNRQGYGDGEQNQRSNLDTGHPSAGEGAELEASHSAVRVMSKGHYSGRPSETSDSTDNEQEDKRRRFKKRYELDRNKSTSLQNVSSAAQFSLPPDQQGFDSEFKDYVSNKSEHAGQGSKDSESRDLSGSRLRGYTDAPQSVHSYDVKTMKSPSERKDFSSSDGAGRRPLHSDADNMSSPHTYSQPHHHSLHPPLRSSQLPAPPPPPPAAQHSRQTSRMGGSASNGRPAVVSGHSPSSGGGVVGGGDAAGTSPAFSSGRPRANSGATSHSLSPHQHLQGPGGMMRDPKQQRPDSHHRPDSQQRPDSHHRPDSQQRPDSHHRPDSQQRPDSHHRFDTQQRPDSHHRFDTQQRPDSHHRPDTQQRPDSHHRPDTQQRPDSHHRPDTQQRPDSHQPFRNSPNQQQQTDTRGFHGQFNDSSNLSPQGCAPSIHNMSSGSYSPAFSHSSKENNNSSGNAGHSRTSSLLESQGFVYGQHREPLGKPPTSANPKILTDLRNSHSPLNNSKGELENVAVRSSPGRSEVNNNARKWDGVSRAGRSTVGPPKNRDRSPVRRTQHKAKPQLAWDQEIAEYRKKGQVVYHSAMIQLSMTPEIDRFIHDIDEDNKTSIETKLTSVDQELTMQRRQRRKSQAFYKKLTEPSAKQAKGDNKAVVSQVLKDMSEMTSKLRFLDLCRTHLQMLLAELHGVDTCFLFTLVMSPWGGGPAEGEPQPLVLQPYLENHLLQFQTVRETTTGCEVQVLQAGHPKGLLAYLFTLSALSDGFIHQFLFCFRYFVTAEDVFAFITNRYVSARRGNQTDVNVVRTQHRAMDLLQFWVEGFYSLDFERNESLLDSLEAFVMQRVAEDRDGSQNLMNLLYACHLGENSELVSQADDSEDLDEVYYLHLAAPKRQSREEQQMEWESFRSLLGRKKSESFAKPAAKSDGAGVPYKDKGGVLVEKRPPSRADDGSTASLPRRTDITQLMDYPPHRLAEQLTLMEQELFQRTHPVHYLDSKAQGVGVDLSIPGLRTPSMARKSNPNAHSLFVTTQHFESRVSDMIAHSQEITHWVSAEILCCGSQKSQVSTLTKFLMTAQLCVDIRNYATALAVIAGLDNLLVRQLPAWKHLPAKAAALMESLEALQVKVKGEPMALMQDKDSHMYPTIPCALYFLLHLQQLEIGGFTLANGMYKWQKMRSICQMIDQIRIFREHEYGFEPDYELQSLICRRLHELCDRDLHAVAAAHDNNFRRVVSNAAGIQGTWRKVKVKLQSRTK